MLKHNFNAESSDHYETPMQAYRHIDRLLDKIERLLKSKETLQYTTHISAMVKLSKTSRHLDGATLSM